MGEASLQYGRRAHHHHLFLEYGLPEVRGPLPVNPFSAEDSDRVRQIAFEEAELLVGESYFVCLHGVSFAGMRCSLTHQEEGNSLVLSGASALQLLLQHISKQQGCNEGLARSYATCYLGPPHRACRAYLSPGRRLCFSP